MIYKKKGVTIVELLVVLAIITVLASIVVSAINSAKVSARLGRRVSDLGQIKLALQTYKEVISIYPISENWSGYQTCWGGSSGKDWIPQLKNQNFLSTTPIEPNQSCSCPNSCRQYLYKSNLNGSDYKLIAFDTLEDIDLVTKKYPEMIDSANSGRAYGFWTTGATSWVVN